MNVMDRRNYKLTDSQPSAALVYSVMQEKGDFYNAYCTIEE